MSRLNTTQKQNVDNYFIVYVSRGIAKHLTILNK